MSGRGGLPHQTDLRPGQGVGLVDEVAEGALQGQGFGGGARAGARVRVIRLAMRGRWRRSAGRGREATLSDGNMTFFMDPFKASAQPPARSPTFSLRTTRSPVRMSQGFEPHVKVLFWPHCMANLNRNEGKPGGLTPEAQRLERSRSIVASPLGLLVAWAVSAAIRARGLVDAQKQPASTRGGCAARVGQVQFRGANPDPVFRGNPGPWGVLEFVRITIEPPDEFLCRWTTAPFRIPAGCCGYTRERVARAFQRRPP